MGIGIGLTINALGEEGLIPAWIKNTAKFWVDGQIGDKEFIQALQYLIDHDILHVSQKDPELEKLQQEMEKRMLESMLNKKEPPLVEIAPECLFDLETKIISYDVTVTNFDKISHSPVIEVVDESNGGNRISSKTIEIGTLDPNETTIVHEEIQKTPMSSPFCIANILEIN